MVGSSKKTAEIMIKFEYRSYAITRSRGLYFAKPSDGDDLELSSSSVHRLLRAVDQMWCALEGSQVPGWVSDMLKNGRSIIDLDAPAIAAQVPCQHIWLEEMRQRLTSKMSVPKDQIAVESVPSEVDPPKSWLVVPAALVMAASLAWLMHRCVVGAEPAIVFTLAVAATAMVFGRSSALVLSVLSVLTYNLCIVPPEFSFNVPSTIEFIYAFINLAISFSVPWLLSPSEKTKREKSVTLELA